MIRASLTGIIITIVLFILVAGFIASRITLDGANVVTGIPTDAAPVSLLHLIWQGAVEWIKEIF